MLFRAFVLVGILTLTSCLDNKDYTLDTLTLTPSVALPVAFGDISLQDLISNKDSTYLRAYSDGLLYLYYSQKLASQDIRSLFTLPNNSYPISFSIPAGTLPAQSSDSPPVVITQTLDLNLSPEQLSEILLKSGTLNYTMALSAATNPANGLPIDIIVTLTDVVDKTTGAPLNFTSSLGTGSKSLQNYIIKMNKNKFNIQVSMILKKRTSTVFVQSNTKLNIQLGFNNLDFTYIKGFLGDQTTSLPTQSVDLTVFSSSLKKAKVSFAQPIIKMDVRNDYGVPCEVTFNKLEASKTGAVIPITISPASPVALNFPTAFGTSATTSVSVTNAAAVLDFAPTKLTYAASARINKGLSSGVDFLADTSKLNVTLSTEVPLYGQASGVSVVDTMKIDLSSVKQSTVISSSLQIKTVNQLPLDANIQFYFMDKNYAIIDSLFTSNQTYIVKASTVTA
ncbi:MAG TPA: hypothetical protein PKM91_09355, partial [Cyclobacteriaceae bacterium]|nr:hypothetical protein [Cyclobacteriaceae bacterium]